MANASVKRIAAQNEKAIRNLRLGMVVCVVVSIFVRLYRQRQAFSSIYSILTYALTLLPSLFLYSFLVRSGTPRRDSSGSLISPGDDLNQAGLTEWSWDIIYITWACLIGSSILGEWIWWFYLIIPSYAGYKVWISFISPMLLGRSSGATALGVDANGSASKRQEKLRKKQEKGDPRVRTVPITKR